MSGSPSGVAVVFGSSGALGSCVIGKYKEKGWTTIGIDLRKSEQATHSIEIKGSGSKDDAAHILQQLQQLKVEIDVIISVAGGFLMGSVKDDSIFTTMDKMISWNLQSAVLASHIASNVLKEGGLFILTGASGALKPTPTLVAYGVTKVACHHLVLSLAAPDSGMPKDSVTAAILPIMLDTPMNRRDMPNANFDDWTPLDVVAQQLADWSSGKGRPKNGSLIQIKTQNKNTEWILVNQ